MAFKLSKKSIEILNNLASINENMVLVEGDEQSSTKPVKHLYATAKLPDAIDCSFSMWDINDLLEKIRLFKEEFTIDYDDVNKTLELYDKYSSVVIMTSNDNSIADVKIGQSIGNDGTDIEFVLTKEDLQRITDFNKVNGTNVISFTKRNDDNFIRIEGYDEDKLTECMQKGRELKPIWFIRIGDEVVDMESFSYFTSLNFKILDDEYNVKIRQFFGVRGENGASSSKRMPAIQFDGEFIRYVFLYKHYSNNQKSTQHMG